MGGGVKLKTNISCHNPNQICCLIKNQHMLVCASLLAAPILFSNPIVISKKILGSNPWAFLVLFPLGAPVSSHSLLDVNDIIGDNCP